MPAFHVPLALRMYLSASMDYAVNNNHSVARLL